MEVISHRYTERKDELAAAEQSETQRQHDEEMARIHLQTAALTADAEKSRAAIAEATARAAEANRIAEEERTARLKLLGEISSRHLNVDSATQLIEDLKGKITHITVVKIYNQEALSLAIELINAFKTAKVETTDIFVPPPPLGYMADLCIVYDERTQRRQSRLIRDALVKLGIGRISEAIAPPTMADGTNVVPNDVQHPALYVGLKTPPFPQTSPGLWDELQKLKTGRQ
jgi:hypothetical protein